MNIELRNRKKEITGYSIVSPEDFEHLIQYKWYKDKENYVNGNVNKITWKMHRYIMIKILKHELTSKNLIDHINNNPLDNRRENLRIVNSSENARNKKKKDNSTSEYLGVSKTTRKFCVYFTMYKHIRLYAYYDNEIHAAYQYNLWVDKYNINANKNNIEIPNDFIEYKKTRIKNSDLPVGITRSGNKFRIQPRVNKKYLNKYYDTLEEAQFELNNILREKQIKKIKQIFSEQIKRNEQNQCIIELFNKKKEKVGETIVDEDIYYLLKIFPMNLSKNKVNINVRDYDNTRKTMFLSRFIMNYNGDYLIDHINNNPLDNRRENLRIVTPEQNSMNRKSQKQSLSKYIGVSKSHKKWIAEITFKGKKFYLGRFNSEIEAAKARDIATKKYFGEYGNLNFPEN
jgi:hypothetical protein